MHLFRLARSGAAPASFLATFLAAAVCAAPATAQTAPTRQQVQHVLRRFSFSAPPEAVTSVTGTGIGAWLSTQTNWTALDDSASEIDTLPTSLNSNGSYADTGVFERMIMQHLVLTPRQLQAKLELQWLDHFAVGAQTVNDPAIMYHYDQVARANALGNFTTLVTAIAQEPAMLLWLNNNNNMGPVANENFARELLQLYTMGLYQLNDDGSAKLDANNNPLPNYTQPDVQGVARAMTGYVVNIDYANLNPEARFAVSYNPGNHYVGAIHFFGKAHPVPNDGTAIAYTIKLVCEQPSVAPFMVTELLQRFVTEHPSPQYISRIVAVWRAAQTAPDQLAQVVTAIATDPEFNSAYHAMGKQPAELIVDALRIVPGAFTQPANRPGASMVGALYNLGQELFYPPTVFSFYRPGSLNSITNTGTVLNRTGAFNALTNPDPTSNPNVDLYIDSAALRARLGAKPTRDTIAAYLLDAFLDGGTPAQATLISAFLGLKPSDNQIRGAVWLLLNTPDYAVN